MCQVPCLTCTAIDFHSCLTCTSNLTLNSTYCITQPSMLIQIITTSFLFIFLLPVIIRRRFVVLIKILDMIQIISYYKLINGYTPYRHIWLYLGMRSWGSWSQGWNLLSDDSMPSLWSIEQGHVDKMIRIGCVWGLVIFMVVVIGFFKMSFEDLSPPFGKYILKNIYQGLWFAFYLTVQDMSFIVANLISINYSSFQFMMIAVGSVYALIIIMFLLLGFYIINYNPNKSKYHHYQNMFLFSYDYQMFPTYKLIPIPTNNIKILKYSNLKLLAVAMKVVYSFLIVWYLKVDSSQMYYLDQLYQIIGLLIFYELVWVIVMPMHIKSQYLQFIILILAYIATIAALISPFYFSNQFMITIIVLSPFGLALMSFLLEMCLDLYKPIPVDLYEMGLKIEIEDKQLKKQLDLQNRKLAQLERERQAMLKLINQKNNKKSIKQKQSQLELQPNKQQKINNQNKQSQQSQKNNQHSMNSQQLADLYKIDQMKRRKIYQWDKKGKFVYSNKIE